MTTLEQNFFEVATKYFREHSTDCNYNKPIDWEQRRYEIAKEVLPTIIGDTVIDYLDIVETAKDAIRLADILIGELKK